MKATILVVIAALTLSMGVANADPPAYRAPSHNFYQNNWMAGGGG